jgi:hypothetical protein
MDFSPFFLTSYELSVIENDFISQLQSPEAHTVTLQYKTYLSGGVDNIDPVYKNNKKTVIETPIEVEVKCIHMLANQIFEEMDIGATDFRLIKDGDSIFFFYNVNFNIPNGTDEAVKDSLIIIDESGRRWFPKIRDTPELTRLTKMLIGNIEYATILLCSITREEK